MSDRQDQARLIAERVARRVSGRDTGPSGQGSSKASSKNGAPAEDLAAIRAGLHDLERKLERVESKLSGGAAENAGQPRARFRDFVASSPPSATPPSIASEREPSSPSSPGMGSPAAAPATEKRQFTPPTQSPWLSSFSAMMTPPLRPGEQPFGGEEKSEIRNPQSAHPSQEKFGVPEATVSELVDFFESEKKCALEPGKPCDHCAMCSSRGF